MSMNRLQVFFFLGGGGGGGGGGEGGVVDTTLNYCMLTRPCALVTAFML